ncbi:DNA cross-link repair 1A protein [Lampris incognitus]|uniref:DNA cross-link repair 1A protein n=1 Tax=Lampris incognitus TaxID=2546036 RepID=UPI0024B5FAE0|nr:DNA cross-link repair 1A protein [Lampris incognitus]
MSQPDSENDIWDYKPLKKKRRNGSGTHRGSTPRKGAKKGTRYSVVPPVSNVAPSETVSIRRSSDAPVGGPGPHGDTSDGSQSQTAPPPVGPHSKGLDTRNAPEEQSSGDFCPVCQMPFSILVVQSQRWHVSECLDTPRDNIKECPDGLRCSSTIPNHYKRFNHTLLAHSRATTDTVFACLSQEVEANFGSLSQPTNNEAVSSNLESSQESIVSLAAFSGHSASPVNPGKTTPTKLTNGLLLLRSPGPGDFKKKKGRLASSKVKKSISKSQKSKTKLESTPVKKDCRDQACEGGFFKMEPSPYNDDAISYSPLSEFPPELEVKEGESRKDLLPSSARENEDKDLAILFSDALSSEDELFKNFTDQLEDISMRECASASFPTKLELATSIVPSNRQAASIAAENTPDFTGEKDALGNSTNTTATCKASTPSPQSVVLEHLRDSLSSSNHFHYKSLNDTNGPTEQPSTPPHRMLSPRSSVNQLSETMAPSKGQNKAGSACLKQLDIGVFFGLKPLKEKEVEAVDGACEHGTTSSPTSGENLRKRGERRDRQRKSGAVTTTDTSDIGVMDTSQVEVVQGEGGRAGKRRGYYSRRMAGGGGELMRCPFYKKIPGTKFVVDAFRYGEIDGIAAYFLTHFHSDHYGGLKKTSTFPIYCNKITGNLLKNKLRVTEQYIHILPMNTRVTVDGVGVILLDANHCPGAAMLLFFLPDGQTVLHTGDFRADTSMETYPELLSCRVQTLYLDTTYCSPEYTFPSQQDVIHFAASTAFELVTLHPRTLVVCGSYSVGKEKVFLALADILGSKVCLSRDKYNTMCCLESEHIQRLITTDWKAARVHVLPMMQLTFKNLHAHLSRFLGQYDRLVAFKPTGWTFSQQVESVMDIQPQTSGNISLYGIPYSEHSSFLEMKRFVQWLQPLKIIPTVNVGSWSSRKSMDRCLKDWLMEAKCSLKP